MNNKIALSLLVSIILVGKMHSYPQFTVINKTGHVLNSTISYPDRTIALADRPGILPATSSRTGHMDGILHTFQGLDDNQLFELSVRKGRGQDYKYQIQGATKERNVTLTFEKAPSEAQISFDAEGNTKFVLSNIE